MNGPIVMIHIGDKVFIRQAELAFKYSRSAGPGGQNVNKVNTRVTVFFDVACSDGLIAEQKKLILRRLSTRADKNGVVRVASQRFRTQKANKQAAVERLCELLAGALKRKPVRIKTKVPRRVKQKRLDAKKRHGLVKRMRRPITNDQ